MAPREPVVPRFYVDETSMGVGKALYLLRRDVIYPGHRDLPEVPPGTRDIDWMPVIAARDLVVISRDARIRQRPAELELFRTHGLRTFWIAGRSDPPNSNWVFMVRIVKAWDAMERIIKERGPGPWAYALSETTISEVAIPELRAKVRETAPSGPRNVQNGPRGQLRLNLAERGRRNSRESISDLGDDGEAGER